METLMAEELRSFLVDLLGQVGSFSCLILARSGCIQCSASFFVKFERLRVCLKAMWLTLVERVTKDDFLLQ